MPAIGRRSTAKNEELSRELRQGDHPFLRRRRQIAALALGGSAAMGAVTLYQLGLVKHLPDPPLRIFDSDRLDAAGEAYAYLQAPDAPLALGSFAGTLVLAAIGGPDRHTRRPWLGLAMGAKVAADAIGGAYLTLEQLTKRKVLCSYCVAAAAASAAMVPLALPEISAAWHRLWRSRAA